MLLVSLTLETTNCKLSNDAQRGTKNPVSLLLHGIVNAVLENLIHFEGQSPIREP